MSDQDSHLSDAARSICEYNGHEWGDAGGGLLICLYCEAESWATEHDIEGHQLPARSGGPSS